MRYIKVEDLARLINERLDADFDCVVVFTGDTGTGKSNLAIGTAIEVRKQRENKNV